MSFAHLETACQLVEWSLALFFGSNGIHLTVVEHHRAECHLCNIQNLDGIRPTRFHLRPQIVAKIIFFSLCTGNVGSWVLVFVCWSLLCHFYDGSNQKSKNIYAKFHKQKSIQCVWALVSIQISSFFIMNVWKMRIF